MMCEQDCKFFIATVMDQIKPTIQWHKIHNAVLGGHVRSLLVYDSISLIAFVHTLFLADAAHLQPRGTVMSYLSVPSGGGSHHSLWPHLLLAVHAALPVSEREDLVQVSDLLRGRAQRGPQEVRTGKD